ncbi:hypothetical protein DEA8626_00446 [Defluviimonas aquaemixtae]|uniref:Uncharacterized protein n=1 Tax=Albidovulum aquaemixtae TaxID=1542388 RepID=A0A2R8B2Z4_9RHOB|nr:DUF6544 family protein [Defluviimonas aquaemixtae]SPH16932.1 hypothetical protein DEA8626_00446 [Defluviimonas aquaemixtae]
MQTAFAIVVLCALFLVAAVFAAARMFRTRILALVARLRDSPTTRNLEASLPPLVADYARKAGAEPGAKLRVASFNQEGELRVKQGGPFAKFAAWQVSSLGRAGFVWDARQDWGPFTRFRVLDSYVGTKGRLEARILGAIPAARAEGDDIDLAEAYRYLAELPWLPDAILGNPELAWRVTGADTVEVRLKTQSGPARVSFRFNAEGDIVAMAAKGRPARDASGTKADYMWRGRFSDYRQIGPRRLPAVGEVGYVYPSGYEPYFRCRLTEYHLTE